MQLQHCLIYVYICAAAAIPILVAVIRNESPRSKENAASVLLHLCHNKGEQEQQHLAEAQEHGVMSLLEELAENGTDRGKSKVTQLLKLMNNTPKHIGAAVLPSRSIHCLPLKKQYFFPK